MNLPVRPFRYVRNLFWENNKESRELSKFIFEKNDSFMLWVIGLAFAFIAGIVTNIDKLKLLKLDAAELKFVVSLLLTSILFGIVYRIVFLRYFVFLDAIHGQISVALSNEEIFDTEFDLNGNETFEDLIALNSKFQDLREHCIVYDLADSKDKKILRQEQIDLYRRNVEWAKKDLENGFETISNVYEETYGVKYDFNKIQNERRAFKVIHFRIVILILYSMVVICFVSALALFSFEILDNFGK